MTMEKQINNNLTRWIAGEGPDNDIVLSSRVRLARNLENSPYPNMADNDERKRINQSVWDAIPKDDNKDFHYLNMSDLPALERELLVEKHMISPKHAKLDKEKAVVINNNETISIMINEEDHIRIQVLNPGLQLMNGWNIANQIDDKLEEKLDFAFSEKWGYMSSCPTNVGTGLRASVMIHLPALNFTNNIARMLRAVSQLGLAIRGLYGEGSESVANIYQISNQLTLGHTETDIIENLTSVTKQIIEQEKNARERLLHEQGVNVKDSIKRALGVLKYAYKIPSDEAMKLLSNVKLGIDMGIIDNVDKRVLSELLVLIRPAHIQKINGKELDTIERDIKRAELIQARLNM